MLVSDRSELSEAKVTDGAAANVTKKKVCNAGDVWGSSRTTRLHTWKSHSIYSIPPPGGPRSEERGGQMLVQQLAGSKNMLIGKWFGIPLF